MDRTLGSLLGDARRRLMEAGFDDSALEARLLVEHFTGTERKDAIVSPHLVIDESSAAALGAALARRLAGEPVYRIIGQREFYGLPLTLSPDTLEPRPDTEALVELARQAASGIVARKGTCKILDLGTGTGAVALALLSVLPEATAVGVDISPDALVTATANADLNDYGARFSALQSDWMAQVEGEFDLIVSNPPYIPTADVDGLDRSVREHDPLRALDGGEDGFHFYRLTAQDAHRHLAPKGAIAVEIGYNQKAEAIELFQKHGFALVDSACDLGGRDRALLFTAAEQA